MVWGSISAKGKTELCFIDATMDKVKYIKELEEFFLSFACSVYETERRDFVFMQDNASVQIARDCKKFFLRSKMNVVP